MKKIILSLIATIITIQPCISAQKDMCKSHFENKYYKTAISCYEKKLNKNKNDIESRFWYAATLYYDKQFDAAYRQYMYLANKYPNTQISQISLQEAKKVKEKIAHVNYSRNNDIGDYTQDLEKTTKWNKMPITIWIQESPYKNNSLKAFYEWETKSQDIIKFKYINNPQKANIKVYFVDKIANQTSSQDVGLTTLKYIGNVNQSATIEILQRTESNEMRTYKQVYLTVLHEIGHALGIGGHSDRNNDIMYSNDNTNDIVLTNRDINTLKQIYKQKANYWAK